MANRSNELHQLRRQLKIEAALEKVRARTMKMRRSEELSAAATVLFKQLRKLGGNLWACGFVLLDAQKGRSEFWMSAEGEFSRTFSIPNNEDFATRNMFRSWKKGSDLYVEEAEGKKLKAHYKYLLSLPEVRPAFQPVLDSGMSFPTWQRWHAAYFSHGYLLVITKEPYHEVELFKRFAKVFEQTYTRFLDLQKAEAQAREAQIEAALERVRARSLAMRNTDQLLEVGELLYKEILKLGITSLTSGYVLMDEEEKIGWNYTPNSADGSLASKPLGIPHTETKPMGSILDSWRKEEPFGVVELDVQETIEHQTFIAQRTINFPYTLKELLSFTPEKLVLQTFNFKHGYLLYVGGAKFSEEQIRMMLGFARVFEQTYTRFLDLQKAEAQAQEAQIETVLERIRTASMSMHKSDELREVIACVFAQLKELGFKVPACSLIIYQEDQSAQHWFSGYSHEVYPESYTIPFIDNPYYTDMLNDWQRGSDYDSYVMKGKAKVDYAKWLLKDTDFKKLPPEFAKESGMLTPVPMHFSDAYNQYGMIEIIGNEPLAEGKAAILKRISKVFEQTYTRFLDLQKAEAQAREAQIEAALERVRARMLGMQNSSELGETTLVMYQQLAALGVVPEGSRVYIVIIDKINDTALQWIVTDKSLLIPTVEKRTPLTEHPLLIKTYDCWKRKDPILIRDLGGKELKEFIGYIQSLPSFEEDELDTQLPDRLIWSEASFSSGTLGLIHETPLPKATLAILVRFSKVFDLTYTRFLDLQKAEAQAREAKIEAALERIRARTMAMHKTSELGEVIDVLFKQFEVLDIGLDACFINIFQEDGKDWNLWVATGSGQTYPVRIPYLRHPNFTRLWKARQNGETFYAQTIAQKQKNRFFDHFIRHLTGVKVPKKRLDYIYASPGSSVSVTLSKYASIFLVNYQNVSYSKEENEILHRMGGVFEQTYTRFLDLEKAEAQASEAQIEAALERVRARSMAMHQSEEVTQVAATMFQQLSDLGIEHLRRCVIYTIDPVKSKMQCWYSTQKGQSFANTFTMPLKGNKVVEELVNSWKSKEPVTFQLKGPRLRSWGNFIRKHGWTYPKGEKPAKYMVLTEIPFENGLIEMATYSDLPTDDFNLVSRFSKVFEQTYTRFLDLQKAEAQARESQIEAALERIRARALAMHSSDELIEVAQVLREQMRILGQPELAGSVVHLYPENSETFFSWYAFTLPKQNKKKILTGAAEVRYDSSALTRKWIKMYRSGAKEYTVETSGAELEEWVKERDRIVFPGSKRSAGKAQLNSFYHFCDFSGGSLVLSSHQEPSQESKDLQRRAASVFDLAYRRYRDLQQAEAQAREAQIEAALERVRAQSMAMHKTDELKEVINVISDQFEILDIIVEACFINIFGDETNRDLNFWIATYPNQIHLPFFRHPVFTRLASARKNNEVFYTQDLIQKVKDVFFDNFYRKAKGIRVPKKRQDFIKKATGWTSSVTLSKYGSIHLTNYSSVPYTDKENLILQRVSKVFEQTYTRFLDLEKAELQAREAQIESALERVRARAMAMHTSQDVSDATTVMFSELDKLGIHTIRCGVALIHPTQTMDVFASTAASKTEVLQAGGTVDMTIHPLLKAVFRAWKKRETRFCYKLAKKDAKQYYDVLLGKTNFSIPRPDDYGQQFVNTFNFQEGALFAFTRETLSDEASQIFQRFTNVLTLTYRRYLDLKEAEAQAREAQIEGGLERVRAKAMAMHSSEDVGKATIVLFEELEKLDIQTIRSGINLVNEKTKRMEVWGVTSSSEGGAIQVAGNLDMMIHPALRVSFQAWKGQKESFSHLFSGSDLKSYYDAVDKTSTLSIPARHKRTGPQTLTSFNFKEGALFAFTREPLSDDAYKIFLRFTNVFTLTYRRYLDLKDAEHQARESQIEAALERVRGKAMAMHSSEDLTETVGVLFEELDGLEFSLLRCGVGRIDIETRNGELYTVSKTNKGTPVPVLGSVLLAGHPVIDKIFEAWKSGQKEYHPILKGALLKSYYKAINPQFKLPRQQQGIHYGYFFFFPEGCLYTYAFSPLSEEQLQIFRKFNVVVELTYRRFLDLKEAEARAAEAVQDASLDRVRAEIASMRTAHDLDRITPLVWRELTTLGVPFFRCGVFIMDEAAQVAHAFMSTPSGESLGALRLEYDRMPLVKKAAEHWRQQKVYREEWDKKQFIEWTQPLLEQGQIKSQKKYQAGDDAPAHLVLQLVPFAQGMLYVGSAKTLTEENIALVHNLADAFSVAYARYEDFRELEQAKEKVDATVHELRSTQDQLVHSEKMASLGELTAGIAHEIQNPLNFVNNFSEVNKELIEELNEELEKGNLDEVRAIARDIVENEEKVMHHGKRAEGIVKSMLQHSRGSTDIYEITDINALADEYLRLAYHGLRAKDKSFNADFKADLDENLPRVKVIPQDMGRVLLNLINNAFYAVSEKSDTERGQDYKPTVTLSTKLTVLKGSSGEGIQILVQDNGNGIPAEIKDKIFQPFFTTKASGEGTGLGLSLSFDIITKGHGGSLEVVSKEGEGTQFLITLPIV